MAFSFSVKLNFYQDLERDWEAINGYQLILLQGLIFLNSLRLDLKGYKDSFNSGLSFDNNKEWQNKIIIKVKDRFFRIENEIADRTHN